MLHIHIVNTNGFLFLFNLHLSIGIYKFMKICFSLEVSDKITFVIFSDSYLYFIQFFYI